MVTAIATTTYLMILIYLAIIAMSLLSAVVIVEQQSHQVHKYDRFIVKNYY